MKQTRYVAIALILSAPIILLTLVVERVEAAALLQPDNPELVLLGELVYGEHCASCHGKNLEGQANWQVRKPDGRLPAPPHDMSGHTWHHPDEQLFAFTKFGPEALIGNGYESDMPGYSDILNDTQIIAVLSYIKSTWPEDVQARHSQMNQ